MASIDREQLGEWLSAYLDGELTAEESARVVQLLRDDAQARQMLAEMQALSEMVGALPRRSAPDSILEDVQRHMERDELIGDSDEAAGPVAGGGFRLRHLATAAMIGLVFIGGVWVYTTVTRQGGAWDRVVFEPPPAGDQPEMMDEPLTAPAGETGAATKDRSAGGPVVGRGAVEDGAAERERTTAATRSAPPPTASPARKADATVAGREVATGDEAAAGLRMGGVASKETDAGDAMRTEARDMIASGRGAPGDATPVIGHLRTLGYLGDDEDPAEKKYLTAVASRAQLDQKLAAEVPPAEIIAHDFNLEGNSIQLALGESVAVEEVNRQLRAYLAERDVVDLRDEPPAAGDILAGQAFYFDGAAGQNYEGAAQRQLIVRLPAEEVSSLVDELAGRVASDDAAEMQVGPIVARGRRGVTALARQVAGEDVEEAVEAVAAEYGVTAGFAVDAEAADEDDASAGFAGGVASEAEQIDALIGMLGLKTKKDAAQGDAPPQESKAVAQEVGTGEVAPPSAEAAPQTPASAAATSASTAEPQSKPEGKQEAPSETEPRQRSLTQRRLAMLEKSAASEGEQKDEEQTIIGADAMKALDDKPAAADGAATLVTRDSEIQTGIRFGAHVQPEAPRRGVARAQSSRGLVTFVIRLMAAPADADPPAGAEGEAAGQPDSAVPARSPQGPPPENP
jgi:hypothetical protein